MWKIIPVTFDKANLFESRKDSFDDVDEGVQKIEHGKNVNEKTYQGDIKLWKSGEDLQKSSITTTIVYQGIHPNADQGAFIGRVNWVSQGAWDANDKWTAYILGM